MFKIKLAVVGPSKGGKSVLTNFLSDATDTTSGEYYPTQGVRILEFESNPLYINGRNIIAEVELWDCSGDDRFESCWPAVIRDNQGVVFVFNPDQGNISRELDKLYAHFAHVPGLKDTQCIVFALPRTGSLQNDSSRQLSSSFNKIILVEANLEEDAEAIRAEFNKYLNRVIAFLHERRDQEELNIMNS